MASFREQLKQFFAKTFKGNLIEVCKPKQFLLDIGLPDMPICIRPAKLSLKIRKHNLTSDMLKNLPSDINAPILAFASDIYTGGINLIIGRTNEEGVLCVCLHPDQKVNKIDITEIASIHGRDFFQLELWANLGLLIAGDREKTEKALQWLAVTSAKSERFLSQIDDANLTLISKLQSKNEKKDSDTLNSITTEKQKNMSTTKKTTKKSAKKSAPKAKITTAKRKPTAKQLEALKKAREARAKAEHPKYHVLTRAEQKTAYLITDKKGITWEFWYDKEGKRHSQIWHIKGLAGITKKSLTKQLEKFKLPDVIFDKKNLEEFKISDNVLGLALPLKNIKATFGNDGYVITDANDVEHLFYFSKKGKDLEYDGWCAPARLVLKPKVKKTTAKKTASKSAPKANTAKNPKRAATKKASRR